MNRFKVVTLIFGLPLVMLAFALPGAAQTAPPLGTAQSFGVLGAATVTNTGTTVVIGDLGVSPGTAVTGFPPGIVTGTIHAADAVAAQAQLDVTTAYNLLASEACTIDLTGTDLGGLTLTPGVYCFSSSAQLTGTLVLDGQGATNPVFIFKIGSTLTTASTASVVFINGANNCGVFWQVGSSATLGTSTAFAGNILALASITLTTGVTLAGRALAQVGAVTMDTNVVSVPVACGCMLSLSLVTPTVRSGNLLGVDVYLHHVQEQTVTARFGLWIINTKRQQVAATVWSAPFTLHQGAELRQHFEFLVPSGLAPGEYVLVTGIGNMQQGIAVQQQPFRVTR